MVEMILLEFLYYLVYTFTSKTLGYNRTWKGSLLVTIYVMLISLPLMDLVKSLKFQLSSLSINLNVIYFLSVLTGSIIYFSNKKRRKRILLESEGLSKSDKIVIKIILILLPTCSLLWINS